MTLNRKVSDTTTNYEMYEFHIVRIYYVSNFKLNRDVIIFICIPEGTILNAYVKWPLNFKFVLGNVQSLTHMLIVLLTLNVYSKGNNIKHIC